MKSWQIHISNTYKYNIYIKFTIIINLSNLTGLIKLHFNQVCSSSWNLNWGIFFLYSCCSTYGSHLTILLIFFLFDWIKYLTFYISKILFLIYLKVLWFYKFGFLEQYLRELFNTASGFHFESKSSTSGSRAFICLHYWMEVSRLFFYHLKTSI